MNFYQYIILFVFIFSSCSSNVGKKPLPGTSADQLLPSSSFPLTLVYSDEFDSDFQGYSDDDGNNPLEQILAEWDDPVTSDLFNLPLAVPNVQTGLMGYRDNVFGIYKHHDWWPSYLGLNSALAITQIFKKIPSNVIIEADIIFNYRHFENITLDENDTINHDMHSIMLHEMGHLLGLRHERMEDSIMAPYLKRKDVKRTLGIYDIEAIRSLYEGTDQSTLRTEDDIILKSEDEEDGRDKDSYKEDEFMRIIFALFPDGKCRQFEVIERSEESPNL